MKNYSYVLLGLGVFLILLLFLLPESVTKTFRKGAMEALGPILRTTEQPAHFIRQMNAKLETLDQSQAELKVLREKIAQLEVQNQILEDKTQENARLREMLGFKADFKYHVLACHVVSRAPSSWWDSVVIDVGWADNPDLDNDEPVLSPRGVVGKTANVTRTTSEVLLIVNENCSIPVRVEPLNGAPASTAPAGPGGMAQDNGILQGEGNFDEGRPQAKIHYLPKDSQVQAGQFVVTSGLGSYFPASLRIGTIRDVPALTKTYPTFGLYREAVVTPTANLNQLDELFILLHSKDDNGPVTPIKSAADTATP